MTDPQAICPVCDLYVSVHGCAPGACRTPVSPTGDTDRIVELGTCPTCGCHQGKWGCSHGVCRKGIPPLIHHLHYGLAACLRVNRDVQHIFPSDWPPGNVWDGEWEKVNCPACLDERRRAAPKDAT